MCMYTAHMMITVLSGFFIAYVLRCPCYTRAVIVFVDAAMLGILHSDYVMRKLLLKQRCSVHSWCFPHFE